MTVLDELFVDDLSRVAGDGKADAFITAGPRFDHGIDADQVAFHVDQRTAGVAGVDGCVGLDVDHGTVGIELPVDRADDAKRDAVLQAKRTAEGKHKFTGMGAIGIAEFEGGQSRFVDLDDGEIRERIHADDASRERGCGRLAAAAVGSSLSAGDVRDQHAERARMLHDMRIGEDITVRVHDGAGAKHALLGEEGGVIGVIGNGGEAGRVNFHDSGFDGVREGLQVVA